MVGGFAQPTMVSGGFAQPTMVSGGFAQPRTVIAQAPTIVAGAVGEIDRVNAFGQVVERDFVAQAPMIVGGAVAEIDGVNAFGQVVERDFVVGGATRGLGVPVSTGLNGVARVIGQSRGVAEIDRVNAFGQVVERDFIGAGGVARVVGGGATILSQPAVAEA